MPNSTDITRFPALLDRRKSLVEKRLQTVAGRCREPRSIYDPVAYALASGGKRLRAVLTLLASEACGGTARQALPAAAAIEILHNFTLVHDDIMDKADLRRGRPAVHKQWDGDTALLAGDQLAAIAYREILASPSRRRDKMLRIFTGAFLIVCEGQGFDREFENRNDVTVRDYLMMIDKKTARVIAAACALGALAADAPPAVVKALEKFGMHLGRAFQLRDDVLDIDGTEQETGKRIGTDILEGKRTYLLLTAAERARGNDRRLVAAVMRRQGIGLEAIPAMREIYRRTGALDEANRLIAKETAAAQRALRSLAPSAAAGALAWLAGRLSARSS